MGLEMRFFFQKKRRSVEGVCRVRRGYFVEVGNFCCMQSGVTM